MAPDDRIADVLAEWYDRLDRGEQVAPEDVMGAHPELAEELAAHFEFQLVMDRTIREEMDLPEGAPRTIGEYRLLREIGRGGMGVVYDAEQASMGRRVALKVLSPSVVSSRQTIQRFQREARAAGQLHHTSIVPVYAMGEDRGFWYFAMELVPGPTLGDLIESAREGASDPTENPLTGTRNGEHWVRLARSVAGVADALHLAHREGIVHRDVKPTNLLVADDGTFKLVDFGLARLVGEGHSLTLSGQLLGTPHYMSPEQATARRIPIDHRTDVYSLGATLYEALTFRPPFTGDSLQEVCSRIATMEPVLPRKVNPRIPRDLETIVLKAMEKDRDRRYPDAEAMARDLRRFAEGVPIQARRIGPVGRAMRKVRRNKVRSGLIAAVIVLVALGGVLALRAADEASRRREMEYASRCVSGAQAALDGFSVSASEPSDRVLAFFSRAIALEPDRPEAYVLRALAPGVPVEDRLGDLEAARERGLSLRTYHLTRAWCTDRSARYEEWRRERELAAAAGPATPLDHLLEAQLLPRLQQDGEGARALLDRALEEPDSVFVRYLALRHRAWIHFRRGDNEAALEDLLAIKTLGGLEIWTRRLTALVWKRMGQHETGDRIFVEVLADLDALPPAESWGLLHHACRRDGPWRDPESREALILAHRSRFASESHDPASALDLVDRAIELDPEVHAYHVDRAWLLERIEGPEASLAALDRALEIQPRCCNAHRKKGAALLRLGRNEEALASLDEAVRLGPLSPGAQGNRGLALLRLGRCREAVEAIDRSIELNEPVAVAHESRGTALCRLARYEEALAALDRAIELDPNQATAHNDRGAALRKLGRPEEAMEAFDRAIELNPSAVEPHANRGKLLRAVGQPERAVEALREAVRLDPAEPRHFRRLFDLLMELERFEDAVAACSEALRLDPEQAGVRMCRGAILRDRLGQPADALVDFDKALALAPREAALHEARGATLRALARHEEAVDAFSEAIRLDPDRVASYLQRGASLCDVLGQPGEALVDFEKALALAPREAVLHYNLGMALLALRRHQAAVDALTEAIRLDPEKVAAYMQRGAILCDFLGRPADALADFEKAVGLAPDKFQAHLNRGLALRALQRFRDSLAAFDRVVDLQPSHVKAHCLKGSVLARLGRHRESVDEYAEAIRLDPALADAYLNRGLALLRMRRREEALVDAAKAVELEPGNAGLRRFHGKLLNELGRHEEALATLRAAAVKDSLDPWVHHERGRAWLGRGKGEAALASFARAAELGANDAHVLNNTAWKLVSSPETAMRFPDRAVPLARRASALAPARWYCLNTLGVALARQGEWEAARIALEKALELRSDPDAWNWLFLAMTDWHLGRKDRARDFYEKAFAWMQEEKREDAEMERVQVEVADLLSGK